MNGKILKISANDLYGNVDERQVVVFAVFNHKKYMNKYIIFTFKDEYQKKKLYYGSVHLKDNSVVTFNITNDNVKHISSFVEMYLAGNIDSKEYEIIDISKIEKIELVSYGEMDCDKLNELDNLSIVRPKSEINEETKKKPKILYVILAIMILLLVGITYLYFNPHFLDKEVKTLVCSKSGYDKKLALSYQTERTVKFDENNKLREISVIDAYTFNDRNTYDEFKANNRQDEYFDYQGAYKYDDDTLSLKIIYNDETVMTDYDEINKHLKNEGYKCIEETHYE